MKIIHIYELFHWFLDLDYSSWDIIKNTDFILPIFSCNLLVSYQTFYYPKPNI